MLTNILAKPARNIRFLTLPEGFEQIVLLIVSATFAASLKLMASKATLLLKPQLILSGMFFFLTVCI